MLGTILASRAVCGRTDKGEGESVAINQLNSFRINQLPINRNPRACVKNVNDFAVIVIEVLVCRQLRFFFLLTSQIGSACLAYISSYVIGRGRPTTDIILMKNLMQS